MKTPLPAIIATIADAVAILVFAVIMASWFSDGPHLDHRQTVVLFIIAMAALAMRTQADGIAAALRRL